MRFVLASVLVAGTTALVAAQAAPKPAAPKPAAPASAQGATAGRLLNPAALNAKAPEEFKVKLDTSKGPVIIAVHREWAPLGADRFYNLVRAGFFTNARFFRALPGFMVQFGMSGTPAVQKVWGAPAQNLKDDPVKQSNKRGYITFANAGPNSRSTQLFINLVDNTFLDPESMHFAPFGQVVEGMEIVDMLYTGYGRNNVPDQQRITAEGNAYLLKEYPMLDYIKTATVEK
jgi:peptidyl-prolyl cis-trans isomerase A (cyclophilin A)